MRYEDACKMVGYDLKAESPDVIEGYYAYKNGVASEHATRNEAKSVSQNIERFVKNKDEIAAFRKKMREFEEKATELFNRALRDEYSHLSDEIFGIAYHEAYNRGHSAGLDEIANCMGDVVELVEKVMKACNK